MRLHYPQRQIVTLSWLHWRYRTDTARQKLSSGMACDYWMVPSLLPQFGPKLIYPAGTVVFQRYDPKTGRLLVACGCALSPKAGTSAIITNVKTSIIHTWSFVFDDNVSAQRYILDISFRHYVLLVLGLMWAFSFSFKIGSYSFLATSILGQSVLIATAAVTVATFIVAAK